MNVEVGNAVTWLLVDDWANREGLADRWPGLIDAKDARLSHSDPPAVTAEEALNRVRLQKVDVVLLDLAIPPNSRSSEERQHGVKCAEEIRRSSPATEILALSMLPPDPDDPEDRDYVRRLDTAGVRGWVSKTRTTYAQFADAIMTAHHGLKAFRPLSLAHAWQACLDYTHICELRLNPREHDAMVLATKGFDNKKIAKEMRIKSSTARQYLNDAWLKLELPGRAALLVWALSNCPLAMKRDAGG
jgi:DNA-binding NarL/FixJ family response regulator